MANESLLSQLMAKKDIEDKDIIIVEDDQDTKQSTVECLKKNFNGDTKTPNGLLFYSSSKVNEIKESLQRELSTKASQGDIDKIKKFIDDVIWTQSESEYKDIELLFARDGCKSLDERLKRDISSIVSRGLRKYKKVSTGKRIYLGNFNGYGDVLVNTSTSGNLIVQSANLFNIEDMRGSNDFFMTYTDHGFIYTQKSIRGTKYTEMDIPLNDIASGTYFFSANLFNDEKINEYGDFIKFKLPTTIQVILLFSDRSTQQLDIKIDITNSNLFYFDFSTSKPLRSIRFMFNEEEFIESSSLRFENVMITGRELLETFIPYYYNTYPVNGKEYVYDVCLKNSEVHFDGYSAEIQVEYYNDDYTTEYIVDKIHELENKFSNNIDFCGMIDNYGDYNFFTIGNSESTNSSGVIEDNLLDRYKRNGNNSIKVTYNDTVSDLCITNHLYNVPDKIQYVTLLMYMDKTISYSMEQSAITVYLVSDKPNIFPPNNYYKKVISKDSIMQGWSSIKMEMDSFEIHGAPTISNINYAIIEFSNNTILQGNSFYLNAIIFNQTMKPAVLLSFNGIYDNTFNYTLPVLQSKSLDCTVFMNNNNTLSNIEMDSLIMYHLDGVDIGQFGCNPDKELLLEDTNYREQYSSLRNIKDYLKNNFTYDAVAYSAPYGNLRPITSKIIRDLGYHIAKTTDNTYCSFFSRKDICIPTIEINNTTNADAIIEKIRYAVRTGQVIGVSTYNITDYGDEMNAKRSMFEVVLEYIKELHETNQAECMSYKTFYEKCIDVGK